MYRPKSQQAAIEYAQKQVDDLSKRHEALSITRMQEIIDAGVSDIKKAVRLIYPLPPQKWDYQYWQRNKDRVRLSIEDILHNVHYRTEQEIVQSLTTSYLLSGIGLAYIADSATPMTRRSRFSITQEDIDNFLDSDFMGGNWRDRLNLIFSRWQNSVIEAIGQSAVHSDNITGTYRRIDRVFGAKNSYSLREADDIDFTTYAMGSELKSIAATLPPDIEPGTDEWKAAITAALGDKIPEYITIEPVVWDKLVQDLRASQGWDWTRTKAKYMIVEAMFSEERNRAIEEGKYDSYTQNKNLIKDMEWVAVFDDRTSPQCRRNNGKTHKYIAEHYGRAEAVIPAHYNCLIGDSIVTAFGVSGYFKRWFDGEVIVINGAGIDSLTVTPNHPILTRRGWVAAGELKVGDELVQCSNPEIIFALGINPDNNHIQTRIEDIFSSVQMSGEMQSVSVPTTPEDFHGDGLINNKVNIIRPHSFLGTNILIWVKSIKDKLFSLRHGAAIIFKGNSVFAFFFKTNLSALDSLMSRFGIKPMLLRGTPSTHNPIGFGVGSEGNTVESEALTNNSTRDLEFFGKTIFRFTRQITGTNIVNRQRFFSKPSIGSFDGLEPDTLRFITQQPSIKEGFTKRRRGKISFRSGIFNTFAGEIQFNSVTNLSRRDFSGHVYNLETKNGYYIANNIITHNCRCAYVPRIEKWDALAGDKHYKDGNPFIQMGDFTDFLRIK